MCFNFNIHSKNDSATYAWIYPVDEVRTDTSPQRKIR